MSILSTYISLSLETLVPEDHKIRLRKSDKIYCGTFLKRLALQDGSTDLSVNDLIVKQGYIQNNDRSHQNIYKKQVNSKSQKTNQDRTKDVPIKPLKPLKRKKLEMVYAATSRKPQTYQKPLIRAKRKGFRWVPL